MTFLFVLITFKPNSEIQDAGQYGRHSEMIMQLLRHMTSSPHDAGVKGDIFRRTIYPLSLVVIAFMFSELRKGAESASPLRS